MRGDCEYRGMIDCVRKACMRLIVYEVGWDLGEKV